MILTVSEFDLTNLIFDMKGWATLQVRYLNTVAGRRYFNVHLTKKQIAALGADNIKAAYHAAEYKAFQGENNADSDTG